MPSTVDNLIKNFSIHETIKDIFNFSINTEKEHPFFISIISDTAVNFVGKLTSKDKKSIINAIKLKEYYQIDRDLYRMVLNKCIYIFKKFDEENKIILIGFLLEKNDKNRLNILEKQSKFLLNKVEAWQ